MIFFTRGDTIYLILLKRGLMKRVLPFVKKNAVMLIAALVALITSIIIPPDKEYLGYFDFKTLTCLFSVLAVWALMHS